MEGKIEQAKEKFKTVATHAPHLKERRYDLEGVVESSIGVCYRKLGMFDSAVYHYNRAIDLCKKQKSTKTLLPPIITLACSTILTSAMKKH